MIEFRHATATSIDKARPGIPSNYSKITSCSPAQPSGNNNGTYRFIATATPAIPGSDAVRAILVLAAQTAFELQDGTRDCSFAAQLEEHIEILEQTLKNAPETYNGADCSLVLRRARRAVETMRVTIRGEVLNRVNENTDMDEVKAALHTVKDSAVNAVKELKLLEILYSRV